MSKVETKQPTRITDKNNENENTNLMSQQEESRQTKIELVDEDVNDSSTTYTQPPNTFLVWSLFSNLFCWSSCGLTLFCSCPALIFSCLARSHVKHDDLRRAGRFSQSAYIFNILTAIFLILAFSLFYIFNLKAYIMVSGVPLDTNATNSSFAKYLKNECVGCVSE